jgi:cation:H+ antiporter
VPATSTSAAALMLLGGVAVLGLGASWLVKGASRLALRLGVSAMVVGLTVVGFGTSLPELTVSLIAVLGGSSSIGLGNAVGSNIANLLLVLGVAAVVRPIELEGGRRTLARDLLLGLLPALTLLLTAWDGAIGRPTAATLLAVFFLFLALSLRSGGDAERSVEVAGRATASIVMAVAGLALLVAGAELIVRGAVAIARGLGLSEAVIGLSLVAIGTSLPELATSVVAAFRRQSDLSVGNILGSNVFNLGLILGVSFLLRPSEVPAVIVHRDIPLLLAATAVVALPALRWGRVGRAHGVVLLLLYAAYMVLLVVHPT